MKTVRRTALLALCGVSLALVVAGLSAPTVFAQDDEIEIVVIVNKGVEEESISKADLSNILLAKMTKWTNKKKIVVTTLKSGPVHESFLKTHTKKTPSQFEAFWKKLVFTGKAKQPKAFKTEDELVAYVAKTEHAIGYIAAGTKHDAVKELTIAAE